MKKKIFTTILLTLTFLMSFLPFLPIINASTKAYIKGDEVRFRSGAGTNSTIYSSLNSGTTVELNNSNKITGPGCDNGWYSITYNNKKGYVCSDYITLTKPVTNTTDYRPWTSPKKAIYGGAEFIASGYIAKGQNTSYLKKFNVNPNGYYNLYTHQYMANLAAPFSEAKSSYNSYKENNLLSLALNFEIPIFNNMPDKTSHPQTGEEKGGTSTVTDQTFEKKLNEQGFPETYKVWLRTLHKTYPNWTFKSLKTNIDFNTAVANEKWACSIYYTCTSCRDAANIQTESGWYIANDQTIAYYLDPRNFLEENSILMFEDLSYSENYTEKVVKSVLTNTFMSGNDKVDNISYAKIFTEAGKTHNISPVYLAALSKQEMGTQGGLASSGERFTYNGVTYEGFYNFFNIGAYSSESNPAKAGLVYAASGATQDSDEVFKGSVSTTTNTTPVTNNNKANNSSNNTTNNTTNNNTSTTKIQTPTVTPTITQLKTLSLNKKNTYATNFTVGTTASNLISKTKNITIKNSAGKVITGSEKIGTGSTITFESKETLTVVLYGDLNGDGEINSGDIVKMRQQILGQIKPTGAYYEASHVKTLTGQINSGDLVILRQQILGIKNINQS